ncbi:hypothetical protein BKA65DRAFT_552473 [Rhexocercosporidium sp. MPI-PUGE-AT-0058]|nr:hypothetical protein BKA65DRAFT_552473 [Rhexocercosporidium sp. MPI-PUGE-AT-0058]
MPKVEKGRAEKSGEKEDNKKNDSEIYQQKGPEPKRLVWASGVKSWETVVRTDAWSRFKSHDSKPESFVLQCVMMNAPGQCSYTGTKFKPYGDMNGLLRAWAIHGQMHPVRNPNFRICDVVSTFGKKLLYPDDDNDAEKWYREHWARFEKYHRPVTAVLGGKGVDAAKNDREDDGTSDGGGGRNAEGSREGAETRSSTQKQRSTEVG